MTELEESFCNDFFILRPDKASVFDLLHVLFFSNISENGAVDCPRGTRIDKIARRWPVFISLLLQMILLRVRKPVALLGSLLEFSLNLLELNGGFWSIFSNVLRGRLTIPNRTSSKYRSITGLIDTRFSLGKITKPHGRKHDATLSIMAAKLAYENESFIRNTITNAWKMEFLGFYNCWNGLQGNDSTCAFIFCDKPVNADLVVVAFSGTNPFSAMQWCIDIDLSWYEYPLVGKIHAGFMKALGLQRRTGWPKDIEHIEGKKASAYYAIREKLQDFLETNKRARLLVTGHGSGGALAILFSTILALHEEESLLSQLDGVYTFGQPRVGDPTLGVYVEKHLDRPNQRYFRFTYCNDIVPMLPHDNSLQSFKHFGLCLYFNSFYRRKVFKDEPNKKYFSTCGIIHKYINSAWELCRGFLMGCLFGSEYRERWLLVFMRAVRITLPVLPWQNM